MRLPNLYDVATVCSSPKNIWAKLRGKPIRTFSVREQIISEATKLFDKVAGRSDTFTIIPSLTLQNVKDDEEAIVMRLGAMKQEDGTWKVAKEKWSKEFKNWGLVVPPDLIDKTPRLDRTKDGLPVEGYKTPEDENKGTDSTALPIMYIMLPVLGAMTYGILTAAGGLDSKWSLLGLIPFLLSLLYAKAIALSEKMAEACVSYAMLYAIPLILSFGQQHFGSVIPGGPAVLGIALLIIAFLVGAVFSVAVDEDEKKSWIGGKVEGLKHIAKWTIVLAATISLVQAFDLPLALSLYGLACLYPMVYSQREYNKRGETLATRSVLYTLANKGGLSNGLVLAKLEQAKAAAKDRTPFFEIAVATGFLAKFKSYLLAPDKGTRMGMSLKDFFQHLLIIGGTGRGKTFNTVNRLIEWMAGLGGEVGGYIDDGKKSLVNENKHHMDIVVEPGVDFALFEGLNAQEVARALNHKSKKDQATGDGKHWEEGTDAFIDHATVLLEAFCKHEVAQRALAQRKLREQTALLDVLLVQQAQEMDAVMRSELTQDIAELEKVIAEWKQEAVKDLEWEWNGESLERLSIAMNQPKQGSDGEMTGGEVISKWCFYIGYNAPESVKERAPESIHNEVGMGAVLDNSIQYAMTTWPMLPEDTRGSFMSNVMQRLNPFMRNPLLVNKDGVPWNKLTKGVRVEEALYGKIVGPNLPEGDGDKSAQVISSLIKQRIYKKLKERLRMKPQQWKAMGQKPMLIVWDECQDLVGDEDMELIPKARSGQVGYVLLTQGIDSLVTAFGNKDTAYNFAETCASFICLQASKESYHYFSNRLGEAVVTSYPEMVQGIDWNGATSKYLNSAFNDRKHPHRQVVRALEKQGAAQFVVGRKRNPQLMSSKDQGVSSVEIAKGIVVNAGGTKSLQPLLSSGEMENMLVGMARAIVCLNRANIRRVDWAKFDLVGEEDIEYSPWDDED